jgi:hypothetical protein
MFESGGCMEASKTIDFLVFYSWQSDLPDLTNRHLIRESLRNAASKLEEIFIENNLRIILDEATRGKSGSPNIPLTILEKINICDAFICDITTINQQAPVGMRKVPNPNATFELGYAVSQLGWDRIIMLFNKAFGLFPDDAPFDIDRHRASPYIFAPYTPEDKPTKKEIDDKKQPLVDLLITAISEIVKNNPIKPFELKNKSTDEKKRNRDIANLRWLFSGIHLGTLDIHIQEAPHKIYDSIYYFWIHFDSIIKSSDFFLYDERLFELITEMHSAWDESLSYGTRYHASPHGNVLYYVHPVNRVLTYDEERDWQTILNAVNKLKGKLREIIYYIRRNYVEIDIDELSTIAWKNYIESHNSFDVEEKQDSQPET